MAALERETDFLRFRGEKAALPGEAVRPDGLVLERERCVQEHDVVSGCGAFPRGKRDQRAAGGGETEREAGPGSRAKKVAARLVNHAHSS